MAGKWRTIDYIGFYARISSSISSINCRLFGLDTEKPDFQGGNEKNDGVALRVGQVMPWGLRET